ncbi:hypothetical protein ASPZODRAFT_1089974 [Penicilliopsis zonata CBS 506.65]|uniref:Transmembrane protein n=1 Tax=Penicilliopsis zonata CBS 506.65 TaxID=1073090 RepID=A0A1L9SS38_9EURO|nr:hypothetical protein ASPZODRAFT_1089974 [Penicilliopsis zonata CBS 506.65]OJJ50022.1 hypothetical protein ASPZODRAFT_1089974 [Penicilliopsis zonata CBS 506.65]
MNIKQRKKKRKRKQIVLEALEFLSWIIAWSWGFFYHCILIMRRCESALFTSSNRRVLFRHANICLFLTFVSAFFSNCTLYKPFC